MRVDRAIESFLSHCQYDKNLSPKTLRAYATDLRQFQEFLESRSRRRPLMVDVHKEVLRGYIRRLFDGNSEKTVKRKVATLRSLLGFLEREDVIAVNPFRKMQVRIKETRRLPRMISFQDLERLYRYLHQLEIKSKNRDMHGYRVLVRDIAILEILFGTGARISEVCHLKPADVDLDAGRVRVLGKGGRERYAPICVEEALGAIRRYRMIWGGEIERGDFFFLNLKGGRLSEQAVRVSLRRYASGAGISCRLTPHMIRHSVATLLLEEGVDIRYIQHMLGHSSITTTQIYAQVRDLQHRRVLEGRHPRRRLVKG